MACNKLSIRRNRKKLFVTLHQVMKLWKTISGSQSYQAIWMHSTEFTLDKRYETLPTAYRKFTIIRLGTKVQSVTSLPELNTEFTNMIGNFHASEYWIRILTHRQMQVKQQSAWSSDNTFRMHSPTALSFTSCRKRNCLRQSQTDKDTNTDKHTSAYIRLSTI